MENSQIYSTLCHPMTVFLQMKTNIYFKHMATLHVLVKLCDGPKFFKVKVTFLMVILCKNAAVKSIVI